MYTVDENADEPIMLLNQHIGFDATDGQGIDGPAFQRELHQLDAKCQRDGTGPIKIHINSPGGTVVDGYGIYSAILTTKTKVDTYCTGMACSIAAVIFQGGRRRYIADYGFLMYHKAFGGDDKSLAIMNDSITAMISRSGMDKDAITAMMNAETFVDAEEAVKMGLADQIIKSADQNKKRLPPIANNVRQFHKISNSILNTEIKKVTMSLSKITNKLGLRDEASEEAIVHAITEVQNKLDVAIVANKKSKEEMDKMKADLDDMEDKFNKMKDAFTKAKNDLDTAEDKAMTEKCQNMVTEFAKIGRIKNEAAVITEWTGLAKKVGFDVVKNMIETLPLNKDANKISEVTNVIETGKTQTYNMSLAMVTIANKAK